MMKITGKTTIYGIIGYPLTYTLSPDMHNAAFSAMHLNSVYVPFVVQPDTLTMAVAGLRSLNIRGINVTMPHKVNIMPLLDEISPEAKRIGSINTVKNDNGCLVGYNTDAPGFARALQRAGYDPRAKHTIIIGAGGAAKAAAAALIDAGARSITILARDEIKAKSIFEPLTQGEPAIRIKTLTKKEQLSDTFKIGELVVNATPVGMDESGDSLPVPVELIAETHFIFDLIYTPQETAFMKAARQKGAQAINGLGMLVHQAAAAFEIWTGTSAPVDVMEQALRDGLGSGEQPNDVDSQTNR